MLRWNQSMKDGHAPIAHLTISRRLAYQNVERVTVGATGNGEVRRWKDEKANGVSKVQA